MFRRKQEQQEEAQKYRTEFSEQELIMFDDYLNQFRSGIRNTIDYDAVFRDLGIYSQRNALWEHKIPDYEQFWIKLEMWGRWKSKQEDILDAGSLGLLKKRRMKEIFDRTKQVLQHE